MEILIRDIRHGVRQLRSAPGITAVAVLCIALGVGANTAIFSLSPLDPLTYTTVLLLLALVVLLANLVPARAATTVNPTEALRHG